ncbi:MAG: heavy metal-binding domain-containing protein, partial [Desulfuromonadaceae bacterium]
MVTRQSTDEYFTDPVCSMSVSNTSKFHCEYENEPYFFCSEHCLHKFRENPEQYLKGVPAEPHEHKNRATTTYTCPMHPEVQQQGPGSCPKCGMALEPMGVPVSTTKSGYTCPMHPEILQDHPGTCPKCGMALEPITISTEEENQEL